MDMDGKCAAAIVRMAHKAGGSDEVLELIGINYNIDFPFDTIKKNEHVIIVDFSLQREGDFEKLMDLTDEITWIDHHKTAIEKHKHIDLELDGIREDGKAGCELTWKYFFPEKKIPKVVKLLADYDIWKFEYGDDTKHLQAGIRMDDTHPGSANWEVWLSQTYIPHREIEVGRVAITLQKKQYAGYIKAWSFLTEFEGHKCIVCNVPSVNSTLFDTVEELFNIGITFVFDGRQFTVSLYSKTIDVSEIAKKYGGGGHKGAAGFQCKTLPFGNYNGGN